MFPAMIVCSASSKSLIPRWPSRRAAAYREKYDLLSRREAIHAHAMWQADHTSRDVELLDAASKPAQPYLTAIEDDYCHMIVRAIDSAFSQPEC